MSTARSPSKQPLWAAVIIGMGLQGCIATNANYEKALNNWKGHTESALIAAWGVPDGSYSAGDTKYVTYSRSASGYIPGTQPVYSTQIIGSTAYTTAYGGSPGHSYTLNCKTTFQIKHSFVLGWSYEGTNCRSR